MSRVASRKRKGRKTFVLQKPNGELTTRVQKVGAEHFGIVAVDCAKARSRWLLADFYGKVLIEPASVTHSQGNFHALIDRLRQAMRTHELRDLVVAVERTGEYHRPVLRALRQAGFDTRLVHPLTSKQYRQPADPDNKTDDTDLGGIFRAATHGFGLIEPIWPDAYLTIQLLRRHRRDFVDKKASLYCQIREVLHAVMPGYAECFSELWESPVALTIARQTMSAAAILQAGCDGLRRIVQDAHLSCQRPTLHKLLVWAEQAPSGHPLNAIHRRILDNLDADRLEKTSTISDLERELSHAVVLTPYVLLLAIPGINIVTVADLAGELGPIEFYPGANNITGRAGLAPSRYQSDRVDHADGPLRRRAHRRLRNVLMQTADNLLSCNHYFHAKFDLWRRAGKDPRWIRVKIAKIFSRLLFNIVAGKQLCAHPCCQPRHYILGKLLQFHAEHHTPAAETRRNLEAVIPLLPSNTRVEEAKPLRAQLDDLAGRRRGPVLLAEIIPFVLARLGVSEVQSEATGQDPD